jgi:hypothetical protein
MKISAYNIETDNLEKTYLTSSIASGVTSITVKNNQKFADNDRIMIGEMGRERTEIVDVDGAVTLGTALTVSTTKYAHDASDPVYILQYDQVKFYRSTTGSSGSYSNVSTSAMDVDNANKLTIYDDTTGLSSYYYKVSYYHSVAETESALSDPIPGSGYPRGSAGFLIESVLKEVGDPDQVNMDIPMAIGFLNDVHDNLIGQSRKPYRFMRSSTTATLTADTAYVALSSASSILGIDYIEYNHVDGVSNTTYEPEILSMREYRQFAYDNTALASDDLTHIAIDEVNNRLYF